ncbi:hypothetical protein LguiB_033177 [Lonicera macranthoides]
MRLSCNGCRVLRKGCTDNCSIRPCLQWIKSSESQANATAFLAKFYGRAGLINLINAGPDHLRPEIFRSLLYEACGRIVNPTCGSVGLLWSGNWQLCQNAVESILNGVPLTQMASDLPPLKPYDIRHIPKDESSSGSNNLHRVRTRNRFKHSAKDNATRVSSGSSNQSGMDSSPSHKYGILAQLNSNSDLQQKWATFQSSQGQSRKPDSLASVETVEASDSAHEDGEIELELSLGIVPASRVRSTNLDKDERYKIGCSLDDGDCKMELGL